MTNASSNASPIPASTYRLQLTPRFTLRDVLGLVDYFKRLGISHLYLSPLFAATPGSQHGYDVVDHTRINPDIGTEDDLEALAGALRERGMGLVLDLVPNHMGIATPANAWWRDVLENGPSSIFARHFDVDWRPPKEELENTILIPILEDQYGRVLENQKLEIRYLDGRFELFYYDHVFPLAPRSWSHILKPALTRLRKSVPEEDGAILELESILTALRNLPPRWETDPDRLRERNREKEVIRRRVMALVEASAPFSSAMAGAIESLNGKRGFPRSFRALEALLADQAYRLAHWRVAADEINYRRFFDVNELAAICVEIPEVFQAVHGLVAGFWRRGLVDGFRIDHIDGLYHPAGYLDALRSVCPPVGERRDRPYVVVEKILEPGETLRAHWAADGTTGYDVLRDLGGLFVETASADAMKRVYVDFLGEPVSWVRVTDQCKRLILDVSLASEVTVLSAKLDRICEHHRYTRDFTRASLLAALREITACFLVYRTYLAPGETSAGDDDRRVISNAVRLAIRRNPAVNESIFREIGRILLREDPPELTADQRREREEFVMRYQQFTGPVMAKAVEDTAFYRYHRLVSLNEVGGDPSRFGISIESFHAANRARLEAWPRAMSTTMTHDAKRSEDVRSRIHTLSEMPGEWGAAVMRWGALNADKRRPVDDAYAPDRNDEYLFYQTLLGAWPPGPKDAARHAREVERIVDYMRKAVKEAKTHSSWINPNESYDRGVEEFVRAVLDPARSGAFFRDFFPFQDAVARCGAWTSVSQVLLKIAMPGVPDIYQGNELWDFSLVDPDNRRPVDYGARRAILEMLARDFAALDRDGYLGRLRANLEDGWVKMHVTRCAMSARRQHPDLFREGAYIPAEVRGANAERCVAFARTRGEGVALALAGRFYWSLGAAERAPVGEAWRDDALVLPESIPGGSYLEVLTGRTIDVATPGAINRLLGLEALFEELPVALLVRA